MKRVVILFGAVLPAVLAQQATVTGVTGVRFHVNDLAKARSFYAGVFGLAEKRGAGEGNVAFRINAEQVLTFSSAGRHGSDAPLEANSSSGARGSDEDAGRWRTALLGIIGSVSFAGQSPGTPSGLCPEDGLENRYETDCLIVTAG